MTEDLSITQGTGTGKSQCMLHVVQELGGMAGAMRRADKFAERLVKAKTRPGSFIGEYAAERCCNKDDVQAFSCIVSGAPGTGKSYTCLYMAEQASFEFAKRLGGKPEDYFDPQKHVLALADAGDVITFLRNTPDQRIVILDDASTALGARDWNSALSKSFVRILTVARSKRWFLIFNSPAAKNLDIGIRGLVNATFVIQTPRHAGGYNIVLGNHNMTTSMGEPYKARFKDENGKKITYFIAMKPTAECYRKYDIVRRESALALIERENEKATGVKYKKGEDKKEDRLQKCISILKENPDIGRCELELELGCSHDLARKTKMIALKKIEEEK